MFFDDFFFVVALAAVLWVVRHTDRVRTCTGLGSKTPYAFRWLIACSVVCVPCETPAMRYFPWHCPSLYTWDGAMLVDVVVHQLLRSTPHRSHVGLSGLGRRELWRR